VLNPYFFQGVPPNRSRVEIIRTNITRKKNEILTPSIDGLYKCTSKHGIKGFKLNMLRYCGSCG
jgi:hypothetical protein